MTIQGAVYELEQMLTRTDIPVYVKPAIKKVIETIEDELSDPSFINKPCISEGVCHEDKMQTLDKLKAEIEQLPTKTMTNWNGCCPDFDNPEIEYVTKNKLLNIIDKYKTESEVNDGNS